MRCVESVPKCCLVIKYKSTIFAILIKNLLNMYSGDFELLG